MAEKDRSLPKPPNPAFGRKRRSEDGEDRALMADEIARAAAEGRLEEFLSKEVPDNDYARLLVSMMMDMTGMTSVAKSPDAKEEPSSPPASVENLSEPPAEVIEAVGNNDLAALNELLQSEHKKRHPQGEQEIERPAVSPPKPSIERQIIEDLVKIASDNDVSLDWLTFRALKLYLQEYRKSGRL